MKTIIQFIIFLSIFNSHADLLAENKHEDYKYSVDWVSTNEKSWSENLSHLKGKPNVHGLEIGTYEGTGRARSRRMTGRPVRSSTT